jgi:hypothetical protein
VLPIAFLGQKDEDSKVANLMKEVWLEAATTIQSDMSQRFGTRVEEALLSELVTECVLALEDASWSRRVAASKSLSELCGQGVLCPLRTLSGVDKGVSSDNDIVLRAKRRAQHCNIAISASVRLLKKPRLWTGKSTILSETVRLVSSWVPLVSSGEIGVAENNEALDCQVLSFSSNEDVLEGDAFYAAEKMQEAVSLEEDPETHEESLLDDAVEESKLLDFESMESELTAVQSTIVQAGPSCASSTLSFVGFCRFLIDEAFPQTSSASSLLFEEYLPYRTACARGFRDLLRNLPESSDDVKVRIYRCVEGKLCSLLSESDAATDVKGLPPVLVAAGMECLGACLWKSFPGETSEHLASLLQSKGGSQQPAWTVREAASLALAQLASLCEEPFLRKPSSILNMLSVASRALQDKKFWRVRLAGLKVILALVSRSGTAANKVDLALESVLPYKEEVRKLTETSLVDSEPRVVSLASKIIQEMSWWP